MRRTVTTLLVGGVLLTAAACGTAKSPAAAPEAAAPASTAPVAIKVTCEALGAAYGKNMAPFAEALTKYVADRKTIAAAQQSLAAFATAVADATQSGGDAQLKADGKQAADQMRAKSADAKFFAAIKTSEDVNKTMGSTLTAWLSPVNRHCS